MPETHFPAECFRRKLSMVFGVDWTIAKEKNLHLINNTSFKKFKFKNLDLHFPKLARIYLSLHFTFFLFEPTFIIKYPFQNYWIFEIFEIVVWKPSFLA